MLRTVIKAAIISSVALILLFDFGVLILNIHKKKSEIDGITWPFMCFAFYATCSFIIKLRIKGEATNPNTMEQYRYSNNLPFSTNRKENLFLSSTSLSLICKKACFISASKKKSLERNFINKSNSPDMRSMPE